MAILAQYNGDAIATPTTGSGNVLSIDPTAGGIGSSYKYTVAKETGVIQYNSYSAAAPGSARVYVKTPAVPIGVRSFFRYQNLVVEFLATHHFRFIANGGVTLTAPSTYIPNTWYRIEINASSATAYRLRLWRVLDDATELLILESSGTMASRSGGFFGEGVGSPTLMTNVAPYWLDEIVITDTIDDIGPAANFPVKAPTPSIFKAAVNGAEIGTKLTWWDGVQLRPAYFAGIVDSVPTNNLPTAVARARSLPEVRFLLREATKRIGMSMLIDEINVNYADAVSTEKTDYADVNLKPAVQGIVAAMNVYPSDFLARVSSTEIRARLAKKALVSGTHVSAVAVGLKGYFWISTQATEYGLSTTGPSIGEATGFSFHHELMHVIDSRGLVGEGNFTNAISNNQPPGFAYSTDYTTPYTGEHPEGFMRGYSRYNLGEEMADIWGFLLTPHLFEKVRTWILTDAYLAAKVDAAIAFMEALGLGPNFPYVLAGGQGLATKSIVPNSETGLATLVDSTDGDFTGGSDTGLYTATPTIRLNETAEPGLYILEE